MHTKTCAQCKSTFTIYPEDQAFYDKIDVPEPTLCPDCRLQRLMACRNDYKLYQRKCDLCKKDIISIYSADKPYIVYCQNCWWGDGWDPMKYGREFDFSRTFREQFKELQEMVPRIALFNKNTENSEYNNDIADSKNCYLSSRVFFGCEDIYYSYWIFSSKDVYYSSKIYDSEIVYRSFDCRKLYNILYSQYIEGSRDCLFSYDLKSCQNCILCTGLRNKKFYIENKKVSTKEFEECKNRLLKSRDSIRQAVDELEGIKQKHPRLFAIIQGSEDCSGNDLRNCRRCNHCFDLRDSENCRYVVAAAKNADSMDVYSFQEGELIYNSTDVLRASKIIGSKFIWDGHDIYYSDLCFGSNNLLCCIGLQRKSHSILNKQYSEKDYRKIKRQIVSHMKDSEEWGEFSSVSDSIFSYNETPAQDTFPLDEKCARRLGYSWFGGTAGVRGRETLHGSDIPTAIDKVEDNIVDEIISCYNCDKNFKILKKILEIHRRLALPLNNLCSDCERQGLHLEWLRPVLYDRHCTKCNADIKTSYAPERPEKVYCEKCYQGSIN